MKEASAIRTAVRDLRDFEVASPENGADEEVLEAPPRGSLEWAWLLWGSRGLLKQATACGIAVAVIIALLIPNRFESTVKLMPPEQNSGSGLAMIAAMAGKGGLGSGGLGSLASDLLGVKNSGALFVEILHSRSVQDHLIDQFDLRKVYSHKYYQDARKDLTKFTEVSEDRKSGVITITVTDKDKGRAQQIAQAYVAELDRIVALVSTSAARRERIFLEQRLQQVKGDLESTANEFAQYASKNTVIDVSSQTKAMVESAAILQGQLIATQSELEGLQQIYTGNNVRVRALKARLDELRSQLQKMGGSDASLASGSPGVSDPQSDQLYPSIRKLPLLGVRWAELYRDAKIQETIFELLTQQYELAKIQEAKEIPTVKVLDPANWPEKKSSPRRGLIVFLGTFLSFGLAAFWVLGNVRWQHMDPQDPRKQLAHEIADRCTVVWARWAESPGVSRAQAWWKHRRPQPKP